MMGSTALPLDFAISSIQKTKHGSNASHVVVCVMLLTGGVVSVDTAGQHGCGALQRFHGELPHGEQRQLIPI